MKGEEPSDYVAEASNEILDKEAYEEYSKEESVESLKGGDDE